MMEQRKFPLLDQLDHLEDDWRSILEKLVQGQKQNR
jgi:hypothetical protein